MGGLLQLYCADRDTYVYQSPGNTSYPAAQHVGAVVVLYHSLSMGHFPEQFVGKKGGIDDEE
jgi:hypothetical protein